MIELKNDLCEIGRLTEELEHFAEAEQLPLKTGLELNLVLEEVITNIISYGYADDAEHIIRIGIEKNGSMLTVTVTGDAVYERVGELNILTLKKVFRQNSKGGNNNGD